MARRRRKRGSTRGLGGATTAHISHARRSFESTIDYAAKAVDAPTCQRAFTLLMMAQHANGVAIGEQRHAGIMVNLNNLRGRALDALTKAMDSTVRRCNIR